ncbi:phosphatase PAP2 family protein [Neisseria weaveri]|uniref:Phosphatidylglycerophosphatase B n=1 Tax=Neisseria weaveri TaxID=28091 RepID=A0A448VLL7_9NEIS|nr:phosphatase PAP2 family protein [Neisseria weaveri]SAY51543.1 Phosphatidylglycerophosphatase B [Neisseria weaveri]VEJ50689.1 Phosphatidylglycerophosphatase B [Neisseria weaveri]
MLPPRAYIPRPYQLLLLFVGMLLPLLALGWVAENIWQHSAYVYAFELPVMFWLHEHIGSWFTPFAVVLHHLGKFATAAPLTALAAVWLYMRRYRGYAVFTVCAIALPALLMAVAKQIFDRPRPELWPRIIEEANSSFPSGHSTFAASLAVVLVLVYWHSPYRRIICIVAVLFAFLMGISRMVLGVHYPTDVLAGWVTGSVTVLAVYLSFFNRLPESKV